MLCREVCYCGHFCAVGWPLRPTSSFRGTAYGKSTFQFVRALSAGVYKLTNELISCFDRRKHETSRSIMRRNLDVIRDCFSGGLEPTSAPAIPVPGLDMAGCSADDRT